MIKKLIVNGDDFGLCDGVSLGILKAYCDGILTSTTCMMNMDHIEKYLDLARKYPELGLGVHLNITLGKSLTENSFTDDKGYFKKRDCYPHRQPIVNQKELYNEWKAQIERFISLTGHKPTHLDSHHHVHLLPGNIDVALKLAREYDLPIRQDQYLQTDFEYVRFSEDFYNDTVTLDMLQKIKDYPDDIFELMCHPAFVDWDLYQSSSYHLPRTKELDLLCSRHVFDMMKDVEFITYQDIKKS